MAASRASLTPFGLSRSPLKPGEKKQRVLILDNNWFFAASLRLALDSDRAFWVCDASLNPKGLEERIEHFRPDLLIFDLSLGDTSGLHVASELRARGNRLPIVFLSSQAGVSDADLRGIGDCAYLPKDKRPAVLIKLLKQLLNKQRDLLAVGGSGPEGGPLRPPTESGSKSTQTVQR